MLRLGECGAFVRQPSMRGRGAGRSFNHQVRTILVFHFTIIEMCID
jgi:hypothetical protein